MEIGWKRNIGSVLLLLCGMCAVVLGSLRKEEGISAESAYEKMKAQEAEILGSCVRIQADGHYGSGSIFAIDEDKITIVTNRHVLLYWDDESYVTFFKGAVGSGWVAKLSDQADVGILHVYTADLAPEELNSLSAIEISDSVPKRGDWFFMADIASDVWNPVFYQGQILEPLVYLEDFGMEMLYGDSTFQAGMSGCGVFNIDGKYIGMLTGGTEQNEVAAVPLQIIINLLMSVRY